MRVGVGVTEHVPATGRGGQRTGAAHSHAAVNSQLKKLCARSRIVTTCKVVKKSQNSHQFGDHESGYFGMKKEQEKKLRLGALVLRYLPPKRETRRSNLAVPCHVIPVI